MSKDYESIKVEIAVYKRSCYLKQIIKDANKEAAIKGRVTMSSVINNGLELLEKTLKERK